MWEKIERSYFCRAVQYTPVVLIVMVVIGVNYPITLACPRNVPVDETAWLPRTRQHQIAVYWTVALEFLLLASLLKTVFTNPGKINRAVWGDDAESLARPHCCLVKSSGYPRYCRKCRLFKPDRAHHCSSCGQCVLKLDHHCIFLNNCVGYRNQKHFILFLFYVVMNSVGILVCTAFTDGGISRRDTRKIDAVVEKIACGFGVMMASVVAIACAIVIAGFMSCHIYFVWANVTTNEMGGDADVSYSLSSGRQNVKEVFGTGPMWGYFIPTDPVLQHDGDRFIGKSTAHYI